MDSPTAVAEEEDHSAFYGQLQDTINQTSKRVLGDFTIVLGDFNAKVGSGAISRVMGKHGLRKSNNAGNR